MPSIEELPTPALLLDLDTLESNLKRMAQRAAALGVALRPHVKTHKCVEIARRQIALGARGITVSTLYEAELFAAHGFGDITWAFPLILGRLGQAREIAERICLRLVVDSSAAVDAMEATRFPHHVWLKVDCGYHRAGVDPRGPLALELAARLNASERLIFDGLLTHSGHAYHGRSREQIRAIAESERAVLVELAATLRRQGVEVPALSVGSTPAMAQVENLAGVSEARPGNYALYDATQVALGSCAVRDCAATVLASVISCQPGAEHCVVDAGALALSKDSGPQTDGTPSMGRIFSDYAAGELEPEVYLTGLTQEHGIVNAPRPVGSRVRILPNHSCLTVAHFDHYEVVRRDQVMDRWKIWRGR
ncbi:MAG TPA: alanine racemase [Acidobacteriota bacterium]